MGSRQRKRLLNNKSVLLLVQNAPQILLYTSSYPWRSNEVTKFQWGFHSDSTSVANDFPMIKQCCISVISPRLFIEELKLYLPYKSLEARLTITVTGQGYQVCRLEIIETRDAFPMNVSAIQSYI